MCILLVLFLTVSYKTDIYREFPGRETMILQATQWDQNPSLPRQKKKNKNTTAIAEKNKIHIFSAEYAY